MSGKSILLGHNTETGNNLSLDPRTRSTHMQVIGSTGEGKSKFLEHLIRQDIINNNGLCLIDPHGYLYQDIVRWCETKGMQGRKKIILFDPSEENYTFGFNPLKVSSSELSFHVDSMVKACAQVWGGEDLDKTPLLKRCLRIIFHALAEKRQTLLEGHFLAMPQQREIRRYLTQDITDPIIRDQWGYFNTLKPKQFEEEFSSTINRLMEFLSSPIIRRVIGQIQNTIDFRSIMDEGYILLINLASSDKISDLNARLLGALIVNDLFTKARSRPKDSRPFYLYIDECALFINEDIGRILDEGRKFGLHLILAHQHLDQLKEAGQKVYKSVMTNAKTKVVFGGLAPEDARILAEQVFLGEIDLEEAKVSLSKPTVVGFVKAWLESHSTTSGRTKGRGSVSGGGSSSGTGTGTASVYPYMDILPTTQTFSSHRSQTQNSHWTDSKNESAIEMGSEGRSQTLEPILKEMPTQVFSLEEQLHRQMAVMVNQPTQHAIIKLPKKFSEMVKTPTIYGGFAGEKRVRRFKDECFQLADFARPIVEVEMEIKERWQLLEYKAQGDQYQPPNTPLKIKTEADEENFRQED